MKIRTVADLRYALAEYPDDFPVLVRSYEQGWDYLGMSVKAVVDLESNEWWYGRFGDAEEYSPDIDSFDALLLWNSKD
jgi:hypothetical protein